MHSSTAYPVSPRNDRTSVSADNSKIVGKMSENNSPVTRGTTDGTSLTTQALATVPAAGPIMMINSPVNSGIASNVLFASAYVPTTTTTTITLPKPSQTKDTSKEYIRRPVMIFPAPSNADMTTSVPATVNTTQSVNSLALINAAKPFTIVNAPRIIANVSTSDIVSTTTNVPSTANPVNITAVVANPKSDNQVAISDLKHKKAIRKRKSKSRYTCNDEWSNAALEALIEMFKQRHFLYVPQEENYMNNMKRKIALAEIAARLSHLRPNTTTEDVRERLKSLKIEFLRELRCLLKIKELNLEKSFSNSGDSLESKYWIFPRMKFLLPFVKGGPDYLASCENSLETTPGLIDSTECENEEEFIEPMSPERNQKREKNGGLEWPFKRKKMRTCDVGIERDTATFSFFSYLLTECSCIQDENILNSLKEKLFNLVMESVQLDSSNS